MFCPATVALGGCIGKNPGYLRFMAVVRLSVVIITFNEEANIGRCLAALGDVADEVLVVDSFSTDRTVAICQQRGARHPRQARRRKPRIFAIHGRCSSFRRHHHLQ